MRRGVGEALVRICSGERFLTFMNLAIALECYPLACLHLP